MNRMGLRFQTTHQNPSDWDLDIRSYLRDFNLLENLSYLDANFRILFELPNPKTPSNYLGLRDAPGLLAFRPNDLDTRILLARPDPLLSITQIPGKGKVKGYLVGALSLPTLIQNLDLETQGLYIRWTDSSGKTLYQSSSFSLESDFSRRKYALLTEQAIQFSFSEALQARSTSKSFFATKYFMLFSVLSFLLLLLMFWGMNKRHQETLEARQAAEDANRYKSQFLANMSHEIRTPLNAILGLSNLLEDSHLNPQQRDFLTKIQSSSTSLLGIINDILDFSKVEAGKLNIEHTDFDLEQVFDNLRNLFSAACSKKGIQLYFDLDLSLPHLMQGDPLRINQVLNNLLSNALKFTHQGEIWVSAQSSHQNGQDWLKLDVEDTGIGITESQMQKIFQPFNQATASTTRRFGGSGLGLTISRRLAELMGGTLNVKSEEGLGSTFTLLLPLRQSSVDELVNRSSALKPVKTLIVEDNEPVRQIISNILNHWGYPILEASTAAQARHLVQAENPPQLIVLDWKLPDFDGVEFLRETKHHLPNCQFIMITGHDRSQLEPEIKEFKPLPILEKPITPSTLFNGLIQLQNKNQNETMTPPTKQNQVRMDGRGQRILVVEDNAINITVIRSLLDRWNFHVTVAQDGQEAVSLVQTQNFALILMDLHMPNMDGKQATATIRANGWAAQTPIIALSAATMVEEQAQSRQAGMDGFLSKPINFQELAMCLKKYLPKSELTQMAAPAGKAASPSA